jgi:hypothetical protein
VSNDAPALPPFLAFLEGGGTSGDKGEGGKEGSGGGSVEDGDEAYNTECQEHEARQPALVSNIAPVLPPTFTTPEGVGAGGTRRGEGEDNEEGGGSVEDEDEVYNTERQELEARQPVLVSNVAPALPSFLAQSRGSVL